MSSTFIVLIRYKKTRTHEYHIHKQCGEFLELRWLVFFGAKKQGDFKQAERLVTALITKYPDDSDYRVWRGRLYQHYKLSVKAIADFEAAKGESKVSKLLYLLYK